MLKEVSDLKNLVDKKNQQTISEYRFVQLLDFDENAFGDTINDISMLDEAAGMLPDVVEWEFSIREEVQQSRTTDAATSLRIAELVLKVTQSRKANENLQGARLADTISRLLKTVLNCREGALRLSKNNAIKVFAILESVKVLRKQNRKIFISVDHHSPEETLEIFE